MRGCVVARTIPRTLITLGIVAAVIPAWFAQPSAQKRTSSTVEPFQTGLTVVVPGNQENAVGTTTFNVPAGKRLNLKFLTVNHGFTALIEVDTTVGGVPVTHYRLASAQHPTDRPLDLWADDTAPVTVRVTMNSVNSPPITWNVSVSGEVY